MNEALVRADPVWFLATAPDTKARKFTRGSAWILTTPEEPDIATG